jgi:hypothetical protein
MFANSRAIAHAEIINPLTEKLCPMGYGLLSYKERNKPEQRSAVIRKAVSGFASGT